MTSTILLHDSSHLKEQAKFACSLHFHSNQLKRITLKRSHSFELCFEGSERQASVIKWFDDHFAGKYSPFPLPLEYDRTTFSGQVLDRLKQIPPGKKLTYKEIAIHLGNPKAARAVGNACNRNPYPLVIPCHRVVGSGGQLTGFAYGLAMKQHLLDLETHFRDS